MATLDVIKELCKINGLSIRALEKELGFSNGSIAKSETIKSDRLQKIADRFGVTVDYIVKGENPETGEPYYLNIETKRIAQEVFESKELRMLMDEARDADPEDIKAIHNMLLALKRKERGNID